MLYGYDGSGTGRGAVSYGSESRSSSSSRASESESETTESPSFTRPYRGYPLGGYPLLGGYSCGSGGYPCGCSPFQQGKLLQLDRLHKQQKQLLNQRDKSQDSDLSSRLKAMHLRSLLAPLTDSP